jgi:hypothetical protein
LVLEDFRKIKLGFVSKPVLEKGKSFVTLSRSYFPPRRANDGSAAAYG